jgi:hypothetical protein
MSIKKNINNYQSQKIRKIRKSITKNKVNRKKKKKVTLLLNQNLHNKDLIDLYISLL